jgi:cell division septation protein DedD
MDKYIVELLKTNNRIILPELGAFITKKDEPENIVFNEFLKFNDGIFVSFIAEKEKIEKEEALEKTENFVKEIFLELEEGNAHVIEGLGEFKKDEKGKIQFITDAAKKEKEMQEENRKEEKKKKEKKAVIPPIEPVAEKIEEPKELMELDEKEEEEPITEEEEEINVIEEELPEKEEEIKEVMEEPPEKEEEKEPSLIYEEKKKSNPFWWLLWILIPVVLFLIWFIFLRDGKPVDQEQAIKPETELTEEIATPQPAAVTKEIAETAESQQPEVVPEEPKVEEEVAQPAVTGEKKFYIVVGCFEIEKNADNYVALLKNKGFDSEKFGMIGRFHAVSFQAYSSRNEAIRKLNEIRETIEPNAWLLYY